MGKQTNTLPESLELLLDTMCNTFGGIMFIAIALTIVAQISNQSIKMHEQEMITPEEREAMHLQMQDLSGAVEAAEEKLQEHARQESMLNPQSLQLIEKILEQRSNNAALLNAIAQQKMALQDAKATLPKMQAELEQLKMSMQQIMLENERLKNLLETRKRMLQEQKEKLQEQLHDLEEVVAALQETLKQGPPKETIAFSMETETSAREYMILLSNGKFYREPRDTEVAQKRTPGFVELKPIGRGWEITPGENQLWQQALTSIDRKYYYIRIEVDDKSFKSFLEIKKLLRQKKYLTTWEYCSNFVFRLADDIDIRVSQ